MTDTNLDVIIRLKNEMSAEIAKAKGDIGSITDQAKKAGAAFTVMATAGAGMIAVLANSAGKIEQMKVALTTAFGGSADAAEEAFTTISNFAKTTPFQMEEVMNSFIKLKNLGLDPSEESLTSFGNTASAMGKPLNQMVEAVADAATGEFERLKEFGIRASQQGDQVEFTFKGVTTTVKKNAKDIQQFLLDIGNTDFAGGMVAQSQTFMGLMSTLKDNISLTAASIGATLLPVLKQVSQSIIRVTDIIATWVQANPKLAKVAATILLVSTAFAAVVGPVLLLIGFIPTIVAGFNILMGPMGLVIAAIAGITAAVILLTTAWQNNFFGIRDIVNDVFATIQDTFNEFMLLLFGSQQNFQTFIDGLLFTWEAFKIGLEVIWFSIKNVITVALALIQIVIKTGFEAITGIVQVALQLLKGDWKGAWETIKDTFSDIWNGITEIAERAFASIGDRVDKFVTKITGAISKVREFFSLGGGDGGGKKGGGKRATGGFVGSGQSFLVGERGPELFTPQRSGHIIPNNKMGGGQTIIINVAGSITTEKELAMKMMDLGIKEFQLSSAIV